VLTYTGHAFPVLSHEDVESGLWARMWLGPLIFLPLSIFWTFGFHHPCLPFLSYGNLIPFSRLGLRWSNHDLLPFELDHVHICQERVFVELHLGTFNKFQSSFIYGSLNLMTKNITLISSMTVRIMPFTTCMLFQLFRRQYKMISWQFNLFFLHQVIKDPITLSDIKSIAHFILLTLRSQLQTRAYEWFTF
jgi:hypothetical protein